MVRTWSWCSGAYPCCQTRLAIESVRPERPGRAPGISAARRATSPGRRALSTAWRSFWRRDGTVSLVDDPAQRDPGGVRCRGRHRSHGRRRPPVHRPSDAPRSCGRPGGGFDAEYLLGQSALADRRVGDRNHAEVSGVDQPGAQRPVRSSDSSIWFDARAKPRRRSSEWIRHLHGPSSSTRRRDGVDQSGVDDGRQRLGHRRGGPQYDRP